MDFITDQHPSFTRRSTEFGNLMAHSIYGKEKPWQQVTNPGNAVLLGRSLGQTVWTVNGKNVPSQQQLPSMHYHSVHSDLSPVPRVRPEGNNGRRHSIGIYAEEGSDGTLVRGSSMRNRLASFSSVFDPSSPLPSHLSLFLSLLGSLICSALVLTP